MSSQQQPEKWGYGITWLIIVGLTAMVSFGVVKLNANAKKGYAAQVKAKAEATDRATVKAEKLAKTQAADAIIEAEAEAKKIADAIPTETKPKADDALVAKGNTIYMGCIGCHGNLGQGNPALKAPVIAGQSTWFLKSTLNKFI
ncbi:MAG: hypothetical protein HRT88_22945 [Lentisphaeraceae bacterium]|nr:hypothetical protein [Lentisphaeraceae bacterium]